MEAALLFPIILFIIVGFIYFGFYLHDRNKINASLDITILKAILYNQSEADLTTSKINYEDYINQGVFYSLESREDKEEVLKEYVSKVLSKGLFLTHVDNLNVQVTNREILISADIEVDFPLFGNLIDYNFKVSQLWDEKSILNAREFVRIFHIFGEVIEKIPEADTMVKGLQQIVN